MKEDPLLEINCIRDEIRRRSMRAHRSIDQHPVIAPLVRNPITVEQYSIALRALYGPQLALEERLGNLMDKAKLLPRCIDLTDDLIALGEEPFLLKVPMPIYDNTISEIGGLYVLEGSNMGGQVISKLLARHLLTPVPTKFFSKAGGQIRWDQYWHFVKHVITVDDIPTISDAAMKTFAFYESHLNQVMNETIY